MALIDSGGELDTAFSDLDPRCFPFTIEFLAGDLVVHQIVVESPGVIKVPGLSSQWGPVAVRVTYATGEVITEPASTERRSGRTRTCDE